MLTDSIKKPLVFLIKCIVLSVFIFSFIIFIDKWINIAGFIMGVFKTSEYIGETKTAHKMVILKYVFFPFSFLIAILILYKKGNNKIDSPD